MRDKNFSSDLEKRLQLATMSKQKVSTLPMPITFPKWNFKIHIRSSDDGQYYYVGVSSNGQDLFQCETQVRKNQVIKTVNRLFPEVTIIDKTK